MQSGTGSSPPLSWRSKVRSHRNNQGNWIDKHVTGTETVLEMIQMFAADWWLTSQTPQSVFLFSGLPAESSALWSMEKMKAYFCVIKQLQPQVCDQANLILTRYYQVQRRSDGRNAARTTIRMLESLSRLAEGIQASRPCYHGTLLFRTTGL